MARNYRSIAEPKTLNGNVTNITTQITLNNITGLPSPPYVLVINPDTANEEVVLVTTNQDGVTAPTLKVERAIETGSTAKAHTDKDVVRHMIVGSDLQLVHDHLDNTDTAHGATGAVVGTTNTQTLTNKTLTTPKINENVNLTATSTELNVLDGITASTAELNIMDGVTSTAAELNILDGATLTTTELNYVDGVTSAVQTQINTASTAISTNTPVGAVTMWVTGTAPTGWLICDGSTKSTTTNPEYTNLYGVIGTIYGGTGATSFRLPDLRGRVPMGAGTGNTYDASKVDTGDLTARTIGDYVSNAETVTLTDAQIPGHSHPNALTGTTTFAAATHYHGVNSNFTAGYSNGNGFYYTEGNTVVGNGTTNTGPNDNTASVGLSNGTNTGGGGAHNNVQPSTVINFIIKF
jgi:microcystin-dependent protein